MQSSRNRPLPGRSSTPDRRSRPRLEGLEERMLLYSTLGGDWVYGSRITYSFVPDGTSIGGVPSSLFQSLNARMPTATWQREINAAAAVWQAVANVNLVQVSDNGTGIGAPGNQQGDSRFGDIRISAIPLSFGTLGAAYSPPQINGGTLAGDIVFNSTTSWMVDAHYDLMTVAIHEFGHALGMGHSDIGRAVMYSYYTTVKQTLHTDDVDGIRSVYGSRQPDYWNSNGRSNSMYWQAVSLDGSQNAANQITVANLNLTSPGQTEWFWVVVPPTNTGSVTVAVQSTNLSMLTPRVTVFDASLNSRGDAFGSSNSTTAQLTVPGVTAGQGFLVRATAWTGGSTGAFAFQVNFGTTPLTPVAPPFTTVASQTGTGGGLNTMTDGHAEGEEHEHEHEHGLGTVKIGHLSGLGDSLHEPGVAPISPTAAGLLAAGANSRPPGKVEFRLVTAAAADASALGGLSGFTHAVSPAWGFGPMDDASPAWEFQGGFAGFSTVRRRSPAR
ncbi:matrixin family metalloprotease [Paludisphaera soli]|uniref:matrixin family metalloprotease n=1 Tax=Paludisphaera soli TaxID=2712865 RepID=UPI0013EAF939|nr:matrixin family metalloprotease [Paludisphaera soli]